MGALLLIISIGLTMKISKVQDYLKECMAVSAIKFLIVPAVMTSLAFLLGYREMVGGHLIKVAHPPFIYAGCF